MRKIVNISEIKPNKENPRYISDSNFKKLVKSLKDFPEMLEVRPLVVDENMVVLGGNMRLKALKSSGMFEVPVYQVAGWSVEKKNEFIIKDNVSFGEWDYDLLGNQWTPSKLLEWGVSVWNPDVDYYDVEDAEDENKKPSSSSDEHSNFELVLEYDNKKKLLSVLSDVKKKYNLEKQEDALMLIINKYIEHEGK